MLSATSKLFNLIDPRGLQSSSLKRSQTCPNEDCYICNSINIVKGVLLKCVSRLPLKLPDRGLPAAVSHRNAHPVVAFSELRTRGFLVPTNSSVWIVVTVLVDVYNLGPWLE
jgi:hypothetical protein